MGKPTMIDSLESPILTGECPSMHKAALGEATVLLGFAQASAYLTTMEKGPPRILITKEIDWSWARIVERFEGVIADRGTRISRGSEVLMIMDKPGVLGAKTATELLRSGGKVHIVCSGNKACAYWMP
jgi:phosphoenolpyruvate synthase/pyruvate phosphate dikinase